MKKILLVFLVSVFVYSCESSSNSVDLNTGIAKSTASLVITNNDSFNYNSCSITINGDFKYKIDVLRPKQEVNIGFGNFYNGSGTRFNIFETKVMNVSVFCSLEGDKTGFAYGDFE